MRSLDVSAIGRGVAAGLLVAAPALAASLVSGPADAPTWLLAGYLLLMTVAFALAGFVAGGRRTDTPMLHGGVAAALVFVVVELVALVRSVADGDVSPGALSWGAVATLALVAVAEGVTGGLVAEWRHRSRRRRSGRTLDGLGESAG